MLGDASFDAALLVLVLQPVDHRAELLQELFRVVRPGGRQVVSTDHPTAVWLRHGGSYFAVGGIWGVQRRSLRGIPVAKAPVRCWWMSSPHHAS